MSNDGKQKYFVRQLDALSYRPMPEAIFEIQILNVNGETERCAYLGSESDAVIALVEFTKKGPVRQDVSMHRIPGAVIKAALCRTVGHGERVNEKGEILPPF